MVGGFTGKHREIIFSLHFDSSTARIPFPLSLYYRMPLYTYVHIELTGCSPN